MIIFSLGFPSAFAEWCDELIAELTKRFARDVETAAANSLEELGLHVVRTEPQNLVVASRQPDARLRQCHAEGTGRIILALGDPNEAVAHGVLARGLDLASAVREAANSSAALMDYLGLTNVLILDAETSSADPCMAGTKIARHLGFPANAADIAAVVDKLSPLRGDPDTARFDRWRESLTAMERDMISGALASFVNYLAHRTFSRLVWDPQLFYVGGAPTLQPLLESLDITGRPRNLIFGPFLIVPPGLWTAHVTLGCSKEAAGTRFFIEVFTSSQLSSVFLEPRSGGIFETNLEFEITASDSAPLQIRIYTNRAAFDGRLGLGKVTISPRLLDARHLDDRMATAMGLSDS